MKVIFTMLMLVLVSNTLLAQSDSTKQELPKLSKEVLYKDVKDAMVQIGKALEVGAEHVYVVLIKQQVVVAVTFLLIILVLFGFSVWAWLAYNYEAKKPDYKEDGYVLMPLIPSVITLVVFLWNIRSIVTGFINPEYGAMMEILDAIK